MRRLSSSTAVLFLAMSLLIVGCAPAAPAPTPTRAAVAPAASTVAPTRAAEPTKAAEPTRAPAPASPTAAPAAKVDFPIKGRSIMVIVPYAAGGATDLAARLLAASVEKQFATPVEVLNRPGAGAQVGLTEFATSRPDGHTAAAVNLPTAISLYLEADRKAVFNRNSFLPVIRHVVDSNAVYVRASSPFKSLKDLIDAARANPEKINIVTSGIRSDMHFAGLLLQKAAGVKFAYVHAEAGQTLNLLLGGHVDAGTFTTSAYPGPIKAGEMRMLGVMDKDRPKFFPETPTVEELGYKGVYMASARGWALPGGTPRGIVDILGAALKKAVETEEVKSKMDALFIEQKFLDAAQFSAYWDEMEGRVKTLMAEDTK